MSRPGGAAYTMMFSSGRGNTALGLNRPVLLDTSFLLSIASGNFNPSGVASAAFSLPNNASLSGTEFYVQTVRIDNGQIDLTNSASIWVR